MRTANKISPESVLEASTYCRIGNFPLISVSDPKIYVFSFSTRLHGHLFITYYGRLWRNSSELTIFSTFIDTIIQWRLILINMLHKQ